jgi:hypothetical protein
MSDIYATPESDVVSRPRSERAGGNVDDAIDGNIDVAILETLGEAWRDLKGFKLKCHVASLIWFVIYLLALLISVPIIFAVTAMGANESSALAIGYVVQFVAVASTMPIMVGIAIMGIRHSQGKAISAGSVLNYFHRAPSVILWYFLMTLMIMLGYILLILPGIYLSFAYMFSLPLVVEKDMSAWRALEVSRKAVTRIWFRAAGFFLLIMLLMTLGMIPLGIPLIWIVPWVTLAYALLYFKLFGAEPQTLAD